MPGCQHPNAAGVIIAVCALHKLLWGKPGARTGLSRLQRVGHFVHPETATGTAGKVNLRGTPHSQVKSCSLRGCRLLRFTISSSISSLRASHSPSLLFFPVTWVYGPLLLPVLDSGLLTCWLSAPLNYSLLLFPLILIIHVSTACQRGELVMRCLTNRVLWTDRLKTWSLILALFDTAFLVFGVALDNEALTSLLCAFCSYMDVCPSSLTSRIQIMTSSTVSTLQDCTFSGLEAKLWTGSLTGQDRLGF